MRYRLLAFDFDGTLADSFPWFLRESNDIARELRFRPFDPAEVPELRTLGAREVMRRQGIAWWKAPLAARSMRRRMERDSAAIPLFPGIADALRRLAAAGFVLAVVTSNSEDNVRRVLGPETSALVGHWECGVGLFGKARRYRRLLRRSGVPASEALAIGDELRDRDAALAAGVDFAAVAWGYTDRGALAASRPVMLFESVEEMAGRLTSV